jgi:hypothetical protein
MLTQCSDTRCFPHIINLATQAYLDALPHAPNKYRELYAANGANIPPDMAEYLDGLESDPVNACRKTVVACRASGIRRAGLRNNIIEGNAAGRFKVEGKVVQLPVLEPILDCPTRWSSTCDMIDRFRMLYIVSFVTGLKFAFN